jgi:hypothetical protein
MLKAKKANNPLFESTFQSKNSKENMKFIIDVFVEAFENKNFSSI